MVYCAGSSGPFQFHQNPQSNRYRLMTFLFGLPSRLLFDPLLRLAGSYAVLVFYCLPYHLTVCQPTTLTLHRVILCARDWSWHAHHPLSAQHHLPPHNTTTTAHHQHDVLSTPTIPRLWTSLSMCTTGVPPSRDPPV